MSEHSREPLAIVGIGLRFPGDVSTPDAYWDLLCSMTDATRVVPDDRWNAARFYDPSPGKVGKMVTRRGGFLSEIDQFDAQFFGVSPREANLLDPQQRLLLHATWEALEDAGIPAEDMRGRDVGVFIGGFTLDYQLLQNQGRTSRFRFKPHSATGMMMTMLANRISFAFDFRGPSMTIDTACSSSLVAVHLAAQSIWNGECDLALAGGVNVMIGPNTAIAESKSGFLSPDGRCKAFDESADGYARGEGGAVVVIKPLAAALCDGDEVYAQILGTAVSQDGHTDGITVPSEDAQRSAIVTALERAHVTADEVGYVEAHGTGTPVGDPVELRALAGALATGRSPADPLLIGSVKTNIGHLEAGAGVAGLIKAAMVLKHAYIPANLHLQNPSSPIEALNIDIPRTGRPFPDVVRRIAGVNSFGFGGTNAHVVLAEPPSRSEHQAPQQETLTLLPISARSDDALVATARRLAEHVRAHPELTLTELGHNLSRRRSHLSHRGTVVAGSVEDALDRLQALADGGRAAAGRTTGAKLAFVCTGMGPQWWRMCRGLLDEYPVFGDSIARTDRELSRYTDWSLLDQLRCDETESRMADTEVAQPANFAVQVALAEQFAHFGIRPDAIVGHSAGEVAAHHLAGLLTFEQAVHVIYHRSRLQQRTTGLGRMLAVGLSAEMLRETVDLGENVSVAAVNSPYAVTIAGDGDALADIARRLDEAEVFNRYLSVAVPYHTHYMDAVKDELHEAFAGLSSAQASVPLYSTVTGELLTGYGAGAAYWWQNTRATVLFEPALRRMLDDGYTHFVELGPHPVLASSIIETAGSQKVVTLAAQRRNDDDSRTLLGCVGGLYEHGHDLAWETLHPGQDPRRVRLPNYPWQSRRFWHETQDAAEDLHYRPVHPLLGQPVSAIHPTWEVELSTATLPFLADHQVQGSVVVPGAVYIEMAMAAAKEAYESNHRVDDVVFHRALILDDTCDPIVRTTLDQDRGTVEFAAFTATGDGEVRWTVTATAELNILPRPPRPAPAADPGDSVTSITGDDFYARTQTIGFGYGDAFRSIDKITAGDTWARAEITVPAVVLAQLDAYRFHPALVDGAFQTLFGVTFADGDGRDGTYLPTGIRQSAVYGPPEETMTVTVRVVSATAEEIECDITVASRLGDPLAVFTGFTVQSLDGRPAMSAESIDKGLYELQWIPAPDTEPSDVSPDQSWLVFVDAHGFGAQLVNQLRAQGHRVQTVSHEPVEALVATEGGFTLDPQRPEQFRELLAAHHARENCLDHVVDCWPMDTDAGYRLGVFTVLHLANAIAEFDAARPRLHVVTANAQPVLPSDSPAVDQAAVWGLGRVIGHQEFSEIWGGLIDIDADDATAARVCTVLLDGGGEDQVAIRGETTLVPRLRWSTSLTKPFPTKLTANATYVVTGGSGALGRGMAVYLAERGARHIVLLSRRGTVPAETLATVERLGARVDCASVDVTDAEQVERWLGDHERSGGRPVRGIIHTAGSVDDRLLVNMDEDSFTAVMAPKVLGTRVLHNAFRDHDLEFFVMFGSAGSVIASPGQGNYAAANAFLDAFAHHRRAQGLPALTIGWGPWSVGMVEELKLEQIYAQRGIELITPAAGARILDRVINQDIANVVAISADWAKARDAGLTGKLPPMFSELEAAGSLGDDAGAGPSMVDLLAATPAAERLDVVTDRVRDIVALVFDCAVGDVGVDESLDDLGLDSMMAMEFRVRINTLFSIDLPVLEILRGVSVNSLAVRVLADVPLPQAVTAPAEDVDKLLEELSEDELLELLAELEADTGA